MAPPRWQNTLINPGGRLSVGEVDCVIFRHDSMTAQPHEPDINAPVWACDVHDVPYAPKRVWLGDLVGDELEVSGLRGLFART